MPDPDKEKERQARIIFPIVVGMMALLIWLMRHMVTASSSMRFPLLIGGAALGIIALAFYEVWRQGKLKRNPPPPEPPKTQNQCPACRREVAPSLTICPNCHTPMPPNS